MNISLYMNHVMLCEAVKVAAKVTGVITQMTIMRAAD